jgi:hypothetical protein
VADDDVGQRCDEGDQDECDRDEQGDLESLRVAAAGAGQVGEEDRADGRDPDGGPDALPGLDHPTRAAALAGRHLRQGDRLVGRDDQATAEAGDEQGHGGRERRGMSGDDVHREYRAREADRYEREADGDQWAAEPVDETPT